MRSCSECTRPITRPRALYTCSASCATERKLRLQDERRDASKPNRKTRWSPRKEREQAIATDLARKMIHGPLSSDERRRFSAAAGMLHKRSIVKQPRRDRRGDPPLPSKLDEQGRRTVDWQAFHAECQRPAERRR